MGEEYRKYLRSFLHELRADLSAALGKTEVKQLTQSEKIALCFYACCEMEFVNEGDKMTYRTKHPVGFAFYDGNWHVYEQRQWGE